jgi:hypothetical protein
MLIVNVTTNHEMQMSPKVHKYGKLGDANISTYSMANLDMLIVYSLVRVADCPYMHTLSY